MSSSNFEFLKYVEIHFPDQILSMNKYQQIRKEEIFCEKFEHSECQ